MPCVTLLTKNLFVFPKIVRNDSKFTRTFSQREVDRKTCGHISEYSKQRYRTTYITNKKLP